MEIPNDKQQLRKRLTRLQYSVTQEDDTEEPFKNQYYDCHKQGVYTCIVCGKSLFSSQAKYDSGSGWPSFFEELSTANITQIKEGEGKFVSEVRCSRCNSHLGHLFQDGPKEKTGKRYCINSASLNLRGLQ